MKFLNFQGLGLLIYWKTRKLRQHKSFTVLENTPTSNLPE